MPFESIWLTKILTNEIWGHQDLDKLQSGKQTKNKICGYRSPSAGTSGLKTTVRKVSFINEQSMDVWLKSTKLILHLWMLSRWTGNRCLMIIQKVNSSNTFYHRIWTDTVFPRIVSAETITVRKIVLKLFLFLYFRTILLKFRKATHHCF